MFWIALSNAASFTDVTASVGLSDVGSYAASWGDYDADGDLDLHAYPTIWENDGGTFTSVGTAAGRCNWSDFDQDGDLDLFCWAWTRAYLVWNEEGTWVEDDLPSSGVYDSRGAAVADLDGDGLDDVYLGAYESNGYEVDVIYFGHDWAVGWTEPDSGPYTAYTKPGRGVTMCDFDEDFDVDVYVSNYRLEQNSLWLNDGTGTFDEVGLERNVGGTDKGWEWSFGHTIGSAWGDLDEDGDFDLFVGNFSHDYWYQDRPFFMENLGSGGGWEFADRSSDAALTWQESFASPTLSDVDNDGDLDLYFTTVYSGDYPVLMQNDGDWSFTDVTSDAGLSWISATYQGAFGDYDSDGDQDLLTGGVLYRNDTSGNHWITLALTGDGESSSLQAWGAQARIEVGDQIITRQVSSGVGEGNQNEPTLHFGLGPDAVGPVEVEIRWPDGRTEVHELEIDQRHDITECRDEDGDGFDPPECDGLDCDDADATIFPGAEDAWYDGIDQDCGENDDFDQDLDGYASAEFEGDDCDDEVAAIHPGAEDTWYDGVDADCAGNDDYDRDGDGFAADHSGGEDCDDGDPEVLPEDCVEGTEEIDTGSSVESIEEEDPAQISRCSTTTGPRGWMALLLALYFVQMAAKRSSPPSAKPTTETGV